LKWGKEPSTTSRYRLLVVVASSYTLVPRAIILSFVVVLD
jgi:hypothetical protein